MVPVPKHAISLRASVLANPISRAANATNAVWAATIIRNAYVTAFRIKCTEITRSSKIMIQHVTATSTVHWASPATNKACVSAASISMEPNAKSARPTFTTTHCAKVLDFLIKIGYISVFEKSRIFSRMQLRPAWNLSVVSWL